jgi:hypothetical protein
LMSTFLVAPDQIDNVLGGFRKQFAIIRKQPGLISAQLHRCVAGSSLFMNYIVWEWVDDFKRGYELAVTRAFPNGTLVPVPPLCVVGGALQSASAIPMHTNPWLLVLSVAGALVLLALRSGLEVSQITLKTYQPDA